MLAFDQVELYRIHPDDDHRRKISRLTFSHRYIRDFRPLMMLDKSNVNLIDSLEHEIPV